MPDNPFYAAIKVLQEHGWHQGEYVGPDGQRCVLSALDRGCELVAQDGWNLADRAETLLRRFTNTLIHTWNDAPERTYEDVILTLKHAAEAWNANG